MAYVPSGKSSNIRLLNNMETLTIPLMRYLKNKKNSDIAKKYEIRFVELEEAVKEREECMTKLKPLITKMLISMIKPILIIPISLAVLIMIISYFVNGFSTTVVNDIFHNQVYSFISSIVFLAIVFFVSHPATFEYAKCANQAAGLLITITALSASSTLKSAPVCDTNFFKFYKFITSQYHKKELIKMLEEYRQDLS